MQRLPNILENLHGALTVSAFATGKKDTLISVVQADTYKPDYIPPGVQRIAKLLAGRASSSAASLGSPSQRASRAAQAQKSLRSFAAQA